MVNRLTGKIALVTGAGSGIGKASAEILAREGARVVVSDINKHGGNETVYQIRNGGGEAIFIGADVSQTREVEKLIHLTVEQYGRLDCAINNAGVVPPLSFIAESEEEDFDRVMRINLKGVWLGMKYQIQQMLHQGEGVIVNISSAAGLVGFPGITPYVASKHGIIGITKNAALEYAQAGIRVNAICPGIINTPLLRIFPPEIEEQAIQNQPIGRLGEPTEVATTNQSVSAGRSGMSFS